MVKCKAMFELRRDNRTTTETLLYRASGREELFTLIRAHAENAGHNGFYVNRIVTESIWRRPRLIAWTG